jgi:hypothetical protein
MSIMCFTCPLNNVDVVKQSEGEGFVWFKAGRWLRGVPGAGAIRRTH